MIPAKIRIKYKEGDIGIIEVNETGKIDVTGVKLTTQSDGPVLFKLVKDLLPWMNRNQVKVIEIEQEEG